MEGCRAVVTGASSGLGRHLALELARYQTKLMLVARREPLLRQLADELQRMGACSDIVAGDVTVPDIRREIAGRAHLAWGGIDLLINNAGVSAHGRFETADPNRLRQIMEVNFIAPAELIRIFLPSLKESAAQGRHPMVVNIASILGHRAIPFNSEYCASKFALRGFSEALRAEFAPAGIDVLLASPGTTDTPLFEHLIEKQGELPWPTRRGASVSKVAKAIVRAIRRGKSESVPSASGRLLIWLNRFAPRLVDKCLERYGGRR
jgi:short-subunit dehydrogenase